ncbi:charged multivesicular body protein-like protein 6 [Aaosphaeria arxii CBS 175.79]|uniref:Charged multivesicular body protein-like protein 6 n=1 Tax=Aaosphaeria arxii CBS 175.79 TaxID=1450172 RepID=A0A6A5XB21_9PLEO|nr:charged multivesicular body protein-like protein 6 [Aaosphaeria arxii CBS 175.79]KAF2010162.1 charged multivesicular body protein-like protein 6 [Aaosphaeria arxii CBS 175.79]
MGNSGSTNKISAQDKAILDMKNQRDKLHQYQKRITVITDRELAVAKECLKRGDEKKAKLALRRKKYQESLLAKADAQLAQLEQLTHDVEFAQLQKDVMFGLQQGTQVLKEIHKEMGGVEQVEKLLEENAEARAYQEEISNMLANNLSNQDEDEVEDELEALEAELSGIDLPTAPANKIELTDAQKAEIAKERAKKRARDRAAEQQQRELIPA